MRLKIWSWALVLFHFRAKLMSNFVNFVTFKLNAPSLTLYKFFELLLGIRLVYQKILECFILVINLQLPSKLTSLLKYVF